jgi:hypothetical protein
MTRPMDLKLLERLLRNIRGVVQRASHEWFIPSPVASEPTMESILFNSPEGMFTKIWIGLLFCYCSEPKSSEYSEYKHSEMFGDGFLWGGYVLILINYHSCAILHNLNQKHVFYAFDFTHHLLGLVQGQEKQKTSLKLFITEANRAVRTCEQAFHFFEQPQLNL